MKQIYMDSRDRVSGNQCDFTVQLSQTLTITSQNRLRIDLLRLPISVPTIQTQKNDTLIILVGSTSYTVTLPQGQMDGSTLAGKHPPNTPRCSRAGFLDGDVRRDKHQYENLV